MPRLMFSFRSLSLALIPLAALTLTGCAEQGEARVPVFPVSGQLQIEGEKPETAVVVFHSLQKGVPIARGTAGPDGKFKLTTYEAEDGAAPGEYAVTVALFKPVIRDGSAIPGPNALPDKYATPHTTPFKLTVAPGPNELAPLVVKK